MPITLSFPLKFNKHSPTLVFKELKLIAGIDFPLFENLKILKSKVIKKKNIASFLKSKNGYSIKSIAFN